MTSDPRRRTLYESITRLAVPVSRAVPTGRTNAYLVGSERALLVDPPARTDALDELIAARNIAALAVTHTHPDHVGAVAHYAAETGATVYAHRSHTPAFEAATGVEPDRLLGEGSTLATDAGAVTVLETPGHARDHVTFEVEVESETVAIVGDLAVAEGSVAVQAPEGDMRAYLTSLRRLRARAPTRLYPGHGRVIDDPRETVDRLIAHRLTRERRVREAVHEGARSLDAVVDAAYDTDLTGVRPLARATVRAHLEKLAVEGSVDIEAFERAGEEF